MPSIAGTTYLPHDKLLWWDRIIKPNEINVLFWEPLPPRSGWSAPSLEMDFVAVGEQDESLANDIRAIFRGDSSTNEFIKMGFMDIEGWFISNSHPLTADFDATPEQIVDDWIPKIPVPHVSSGDLPVDDQIVTIDESTGETNNEVGEAGQENIADTGGADNGVATRHPAVIDFKSIFTLGPRKIFQKRVYLGLRHGNAIPVGEGAQRYAASVSASIQAVRSEGTYGIVIFTVSMPHINAMGNEYDEITERLAPWDNWQDMIMMYQRVPLEQFEMMDELTIAQANMAHRADLAAGSDASRDASGLWGITDGYRKYIRSKRNYSVKKGVWEQKPLMCSIRMEHTVHVPFTLIPPRM